MKIRPIILSLMLAATAAAPLAATNRAAAATAEDLKSDSQRALDTLYRTNRAATAIGRQAKAILIFPNIVKAGLIFGAGFGEGVLMQKGAPTGYYNSITGSWGFQAGVQSYGYVVFLMSDKAIEYLNKSEGWELGVGPTVVVVDEGVARNLSTSTLQNDAYAFIFDQQGLMAGVSIEGTKISRIKPQS
jgi:lipid-binding SYLF domain-containing protein